jgi:nicotinamidase/pyrazinamidase
VILDVSKTALIEVDVQNDFCPAYTGADGRERPAGALAVPGGGAVVAPLNTAAALVAAGGGVVVASQDWHPADHVSFAASHAGRNAGDIITVPANGADGGEIAQMLWPVHCVRESAGAAFHDALDTTLISRVIRKGQRRELDSYSVFFENDRRASTELADYLKKFPLDTLIFGGLATDYCVFYSVMDSLRLGYKTIVLSGAVAGVNLPEGSVERAVRTMKAAGALFVSLEELAAQRRI